MRSHSIHTLRIPGPRSDHQAFSFDRVCLVPVTCRLQISLTLTLTLTLALTLTLSFSVCYLSTPNQARKEVSGKEHLSEEESEVAKLQCPQR